MTDRDEQFVELRPLLLSVAYRMSGSATEAEDVVQDAYLRWMSVDATQVQSPRAFLCTTVTRLCIDRSRSAQVRKETYHGPWLPEPVALEDSDPAAGAELADTLSLAFLVLLEELGPVERAAFLLREVFGYEYGDVAAMTDQSEANARQLVSRARKRIAERRRRFDADHQRGLELTQEFMVACATGDVSALMSLLSDDVVVWTDGGGFAKAAPRPIVGPWRSARFLIHVSKNVPDGAAVRDMEINGQPGLVIEVGGMVTVAIAFDILDGQMSGIRVVVNPDKLAALQPGATRFPALP